MNILMIGGSKFVGLALTKRLTKNGHSVTLYHRNGNSDLPYNQYAGDMNDAECLGSCLKTIKPNCIIHMYAMNGGHIETLKSALLTSAIEAPRLVVISSADVYKAFEVLHKLSAAPVQSPPFSENSPLRDIPLYHDDGNDYEKKDVEKAAQSLVGICVRLGMVYGENDPQKRFTDIFVAMNDGAAVVLLINLANWRSCYIGVNNAAYGIALLVEKGKAGERYNLAGDEVLTELEWREKIAKLLNWQGEIKLSEENSGKLNFAQDLILDTTKIKSELGYQDIFSTEEELSKCPRS